MMLNLLCPLLSTTRKVAFSTTPLRLLHISNQYNSKILTTLKIMRTDKQRRESDKVTDDYKIIYKSKTSDYIVNSYKVSFFCSASYIITLALSETSRNFIFANATTLELGIVGSFGIVLLWTIYYLATINILHMYYSEEKDNFIAVFTKLHPNFQNQVIFQSGDLTPIVFKSRAAEVLGQLQEVLFVYKNSRYVILDPACFSKGAYYNKLFKF